MAKKVTNVVLKIFGTPPRPGSGWMLLQCARCPKVWEVPVGTEVAPCDCEDDEATELDAEN